MPKGRLAPAQDRLLQREVIRMPVLRASCSSSPPFCASLEVYSMAVSDYRDEYL